MDFKIVDKYEQICDTVAQEICSLVQKKKGATICIAAGHSSLGVFEALLEMYHSGKIDFSESYFIAMDEWLGMSEQDSGSAGDFLRKNFLSKVNFPEENISLFNGHVEPIEEELARVSNYITSHGGMDYMVLGMGMNGHLALNEPGSAFGSRTRVTEIDSVTKKVGQKYFDTAPTLMGGLTIGLRDICETRRLVLVINGERKAEITKKLYESPVTESLPASVLKTVENCTIYCDGAAASLIK